MTEADKKKIAKIMEKHGVIVGYLFGSAARGAMGPLSDIDVAVLFADSAQEMQEKALENIRNDIAELFHREQVDVINLNRETNPVLLHEAVLAGQPVLVKDTYARARLSCHVLREYEDTRYLRETSYRILREQIQSGTFGKVPIAPQTYVANQ